MYDNIFGVVVHFVLEGKEMEKRGREERGGRGRKRGLGSGIRGSFCTINTTATTTISNGMAGAELKVQFALKNGRSMSRVGDRGTTRPETRN